MNGQAPDGIDPLKDRLREVETHIQFLETSRGSAEQALLRLADAESRVERFVQTYLARAAEVDTLLSVSEAKLKDLEERVDLGVRDIQLAAEKARVDAEQSLSQLQSLTSAGESARQQIDAHLSQATSTNDALLGVLSGARQTLIEIDAVKSEALANQSVVAAISASKESFEKEANVRLAEIDSTLAGIRTDRNGFDAYRAEVAQQVAALTSQADAMLFGATNAGIASWFKEEVKALDGRILSGTIWFIIGILCLALSLAPMFTYITRVAAGHEISAASVIARSVLLIPASWMTLHFARRVAANFDLRQQYVHKFALASAIEPFRRQAGDLASDAIAGVLRELLKNPASQVARRHRRIGEGPVDGQDMIGDLAKRVGIGSDSRSA